MRSGHTGRDPFRRLPVRWALLFLLSTAAAVFWPGPAFQAQAVDPCVPPNGNAIVCENALAGTPQSEWDVAGAGDLSIQGFATDISVNRGETVQFKIDTDAAAYRLDIYRMGYYGGAGARLVATVNPSATLPQVQPDCLDEPATGLVDCGNWQVSASWPVPATAVSGIYFARAERLDTGGASHIVFVVRHDGGTSDLLFQTSDTTWQAYNRYGGNSLYIGSPVGRAYKVSYNRPFTTRDVRAGRLGLQRRVPDGPLAREQRLQRQLHDRRRFGSSGHAAAEPSRVPLGRPRRVLVRRPAHERRGGAGSGRPPGLLQRQRGLLEDALGEQHRARRRHLPHARLLQGDPRGRQDRSAGEHLDRAPGAIRASAPLPTAAVPRTR